ncbi:DUF7687 domain-containing protein [Nesterenkonia alba]|uniref:DUF7687 domain-containing protein n=1 Tax=Nesterenkonia alba TaxID=515814 RepID=UPI0003F4E36E|nr:hypothetical protein [Nesterenkonia alba]
MRPNSQWYGRDNAFWAYVRIVSEELKYARRGADEVRTATQDEIRGALQRLGRPTEALDGPLGADLEAYFSYRADLLNTYARSQFMDAAQAAELFEQVVRDYTTGSTPLFNTKGRENGRLYEVRGGVPVPVPMNKQTGDKRAPAFFTGIINIMVSHCLGGQTFDPDPRQLPVLDYDGALHAAMSRRMDGAYPSSINPIAMWEIKEYYYTTTFGSKISDAVYITQLDGFELAKFSTETSMAVKLYLAIDAYNTWWNDGKSYLCRIVDLLHQREGVD